MNIRTMWPKAATENKNNRQQQFVKLAQLNRLKSAWDPRRKIDKNLFTWWVRRFVDCGPNRALRTPARRMHEKSDCSLPYLFFRKHRRGERHEFSGSVHESIETSLVSWEFLNSQCDGKILSHDGNGLVQLSVFSWFFLFFVCWLDALTNISHSKYSTQRWINNFQVACCIKRPMLELHVRTFGFINFRKCLDSHVFSLWIMEKIHVLLYEGASFWFVFLRKYMKLCVPFFHTLNLIRFFRINLIRLLCLEWTERDVKSQTICFFYFWAENPCEFCSLERYFLLFIFFLFLEKSMSCEIHEFYLRCSQ